MEIRYRTYLIVFTVSISLMLFLQNCSNPSDNNTTYTLTLSVTSEGSGMVSGAGEYEEGATVTIMATASESYSFVNWDGDTAPMADANAASTTVTMPASDITLTADFVQDDTTVILDVTNPVTGKTWMDRNLGASRVATSGSDEQAFGDLYQWGRTGDGHRKRNSPTTNTLSSSDQPGHGVFILIRNTPFNWLATQNNNLWQGESGKNNPCPDGYRLPTEAEWDAERQSWSSNNAAGAFSSPLKLPAAGNRSHSDGTIDGNGSFGSYWSSTVNDTGVWTLSFNNNDATMGNILRASGRSVRCIKD